MNANFKQPKAKPNPKYLEAVRLLPCIICQSFGEPQMSPTQSHHPIHGRFSGRKRPDETALPICEGHHVGDFDKSKTALHRHPELWKSKYGPDTDYIPVVQDMLGYLLTGQKRTLH